MELPIGQVEVIDQNGVLLCFTNSIEIFIYFCDYTHYPTELNNIKLISILPSKLPVQHAVILKYIDNNLSYDDVKMDIEEKWKTVYAIEETLGTQIEKGVLKGHQLIADTLANFYEKRLVHDPRISAHVEAVEAYKSVSYTPNIPLEKIPMKEVEETWLKIQKRKSYDYEGTSAFILKQQPVKSDHQDYKKLNVAVDSNDEHDVYEDSLNPEEQHGVGSSANFHIHEADQRYLTHFQRQKGSYFLEANLASG
ncbi:unnamed protein product [Didymodactylos carnosus]|uniref:Uncharacterized protein n=1 Tax=Didymodactylos carnosus TaxID=1234261 RepID=A0A814Z6L0_9BILA|nr:unnamed protein product [Didymodactylos carnosus]CAF4003863.1 unnamed protein product [Didymodactylos carnosus]